MLEPVADVEHERNEEDEHGQPGRDDDERRAALVRELLERVHVHDPPVPPLPVEKFDGKASSRIVALPVIAVDGASEAREATKGIQL